MHLPVLDSMSYFDDRMVISAKINNIESWLLFFGLSSQILQAALFLFSREESAELHLHEQNGFGTSYFVFLCCTLFFIHS